MSTQERSSLFGNVYQIPDLPSVVKASIHTKDSDAYTGAFPPYDDFFSKPIVSIEQNERKINTFCARIRRRPRVFPRSAVGIPSCGMDRRADPQVARRTIETYLCSDFGTAPPA